ncbi:M14 family metallopeptidase [Jiangella alkaliphila]|uniref:Chitobiase/beta-hexosaminidase C-terminal domain-containing protein n=1 Tax=Jiangella alkaliphila TaxID=419479 RepID=A0A1H2L986_9ACTN|nr:M14 family metallopeptidase [Jiangella alkaliphila]SDU77607.1 Chitobiase/beta-hexosaminidase C-terminal domain-containing protein [Jiangella alkaliphila]
MARPSLSRRGVGLACVVAVPAALLVVPLAMQVTATAPEPELNAESLQFDGYELPELVPITVADRTALDQLVATGVDLAEKVDDTGDGLRVEAIITPSEQQWLADAGFAVGEPVLTDEEFTALQEEREDTVAEIEVAEEAALDVGDDLNVQRAAWFENLGETFIQIEVFSEAGSSSANVLLEVSLDAGPGTPIGAGGTFNLSRFVDGGHYMYHRTGDPVPADPVPSRMRVRSILNGEVVGQVERPFTEFLDGEYPSGRGAPREWGNLATGFVDHYVDATEATERIESLAAEFPELAEIVELPYQTNGYRRPAQALFAEKIVVDAPSTGAGEYEAVAASFGRHPAAQGISGDLTRVADGTGDPLDGCEALVGFPAGDVAVVDRGTCNYAVKVLNAQAAGAVAVVVVNNVPGDPVTMTGTAPATTIPSVMISMEDGEVVKPGLPATGRVHGAPNEHRVGIDSQVWGHEGGNDVTVELADPRAASQPLTVSVAGDAVRAQLATDATGAISSTAAQVVAALNAHPGANALVKAYTWRGNAGNGVVAPALPRQLTDNLSAPDTVSRDPFTVKAIRIGTDRDGSQTGVLLYSQEHAREWVTPLVAIETAERLLRNYRSNPFIRQLVRNLDIFIIPTVNPDGTHYSIHDFTLQRRNMTNHCTQAGASDLRARNGWGVDLNRNFRTGNREQGFTGASASCTSDTFSGPSPLSEPESRNEIWLVENNPNIRFAMNTHTHGGYFMWSPGAYRLPTRDGLERPSYGVESYFYEASDVILNRIKEHRGTSVWPSRVGPISDVLYSAAGNSADDHFYNNGIFAWSFEAGSPTWNGEEWTDVGFTPPYEEGHEEAMEFAHGWLGILEVAQMYSLDNVLPRSTLEPGRGSYDAPVDVTFELSEPSDVYYTLDGSRPTFDSPRIEFTGPRQGQEPITISETTTVKWFAVDAAGNIQNNYQPGGTRENYQRALIRITD